MEANLAGDDMAQEGQLGTMYKMLYHVGHGTIGWPIGSKVELVEVR